MDLRKTMCVFAVAAVVAFWPRVARAGTIEFRDANGNLLPTPPARDDGEIGEKAEGFKLSLKSDAQKYVIDENVNLNVKFTNIDREWAPVSGLGELEYKLEILRPDGSLAPFTVEGEKAKHRAKIFRGGDSGPQSSGGVAEAPLTRINSYFGMRQVGDYQVRVLKEVPSRTNPKKKVTLVSNVIKIRIEAPKAKDDATTEDAAQADDSVVVIDAPQAATDEKAATDKKAAP